MFAPYIFCKTNKSRSRALLHGCKALFHTMNSSPNIH